MVLLNIVIDDICKGTVVDPQNGGPLRYYYFDRSDDALDLIIEDLINIKSQIGAER